MKARRIRRVTWKVRRVADGWLPVVLIGEEPNVVTCAKPTKAEARDIARKRARQMSNAGV